MILYGNLPELSRRAAQCDRVLDVGGWQNPFHLATHVLDIQSYESRRAHDPLVPDDPQRFSAETWILHDVCDGRWPFPDDFFDFAICSHTLEDVRDPIHAVRELSRVAKAGYVEVPSRLREIFCKKRLPFLGYLTRRLPEIGFAHHRWFVDEEDGRLVFTAKTAEIQRDPGYFLTRGEAGVKKIPEALAGLAIWWEGHIEAEERIVFDVPTDLRRAKAEALARLRQQG